MERSRVVAIGLFFIGSFWLRDPAARCETVAPQPAVSVYRYPQNPQASAQVSPRVSESSGEHQVVRPMTVEGSSRVSLDGLRRKSYRYPEQDLIGRFFETLTEQPPLFGEEKN